MKIIVLAPITKCMFIFIIYKRLYLFLRLEVASFQPCPKEALQVSSSEPTGALKFNYMPNISEN
jgi:hypothetical protein